MTSFISSGSSETSAKASVAPATRRTLLLFTAALVGVALLLAFVDKPAADFLRRVPSDFAAALSAMTRPLKGIYLIAGSLIVAGLTAAAMLLTTGAPRQRWRRVSVRAAFVCCATIVALIVVTFLKIAIGRARPELFATVGAHAFRPFSTTTAWTSFPSGETSMVGTFFGACALLAWRAGREGAAALLVVPAIFIAVSRPVMGVHYLSDVVSALVLAAAIVLSLEALWGSRRLGTVRPSEQI